MSKSAGLPLPWAAALPRLLVCLHLLSAAFWMGALWPLYRLTRAQRGSDMASHCAQAAAIVHRFGRLATLAVGLLIGAGCALLALLLESPAALWSGAWGQMVLAKLLAVSALLALAANNKLRLTPRLRASDRGALAELGRSIRAEIAVVFPVLLATAAFTTLVGPQD